MPTTSSPFQTRVDALMAGGREAERNGELRLALRTVFKHMGTGHVNELEGSTRELFRDLRGLMRLWMKGVL